MDVNERNKVFCSFINNLYRKHTHKHTYTQQMISVVVIKNPEDMCYKHTLYAKAINVMPRIYAEALFEKQRTFGAF